MIHIAARPRARHGAAAIEFAVVIILLAPLLIGVWEVGRLVEVQQILSNAAREGGRQASTGTKTIAGIQQDVVNYLARFGINTPTSSVTVTNLTSSDRPDPTTANQLDMFQVSVTIPFNSVRWILLNQVTSTTQLTGTASWVSMRDIPINVNTNIPLQ
jgi:Flp pilus assembly protein TadG